MQLTTKTIEYKFDDTEFDDTDCGKKIIIRTATIIFERNKPYEKRFIMWQFKECKYSGLSETYTEEDWDFLKEVADEIKNIKKELNK